MVIEHVLDVKGINIYNPTPLPDFNFKVVQAQACIPITQKQKLSVNMMAFVRDVIMTEMLVEADLGFGAPRRAYPTAIGAAAAQHVRLPRAPRLPPGRSQSLELDEESLVPIQPMGWLSRRGGPKPRTRLPSFLPSGALQGATQSRLLAEDWAEELCSVTPQQGCLSSVTLCRLSQWERCLPPSPLSPASFA